MSYVRAVPWMKYSSSTYPCVARSITEALKALPPTLVTDDADGAPLRTATETAAAPAATNTAGPERTGLPANKIGRFISASCSFVGRNRRVRAQRARADDVAVRDLRSWNLRRRRLRSHPCVHGDDHIERARAVAAATVAHARHHEQSHRVACALGRLPHALVVVDRVLRRNARIAPAVIHEELPAARRELRQIGVDGVQAGRRPVSSGDVGVVVEGLRIPLLVLEDDVFEEVFRVAARPRRDGHVPARLAAWLETRIQRTRRPARRARIDLPRGFYLRSRQAVGAVARLALHDFRIELALRRVLEDAVLDAIERVALIEDRLVEHRVLLRRQQA